MDFTHKAKSSVDFPNGPITGGMFICPLKDGL
jgi:hypothetical protein